MGTVEDRDLSAQMEKDVRVTISLHFVQCWEVLLSASDRTEIPVTIRKYALDGKPTYFRAKLARRF